MCAVRGIDWSNQLLHRVQLAPTQQRDMQHHGGALPATAWHQLCAGAPTCSVLPGLHVSDVRQRAAALKAAPSAPRFFGRFLTCAR